MNLALYLMLNMLTGRLFGKVRAEGAVKIMAFQETPVTGFEYIETTHSQDKYNYILVALTCRESS